MTSPHRVSSLGPTAGPEGPLPAATLALQATPSWPRTPAAPDGEGSVRVYLPLTDRQGPSLKMLLFGWLH